MYYGWTHDDGVAESVTKEVRLAKISQSNNGRILGNNSVVTLKKFHFSKSELTAPLLQQVPAGSRNAQRFS